MAETPGSTSPRAAAHPGRKRRHGGRRIALVGLALAGALVLSGLWTTRGTLERGNRLFRSGHFQAAAEVYSDRAGPSGAEAVELYNLGTALLALDSAQADRVLERATGARDPEVARRAHFNLGYRFLSTVDPEADPYTAVLLLAGAIRHSRAALRMDPEDTRARWNLALALRMYAELAPVVEEAPAEDGGGDAQTSEDAPESPRALTGIGGAGDEPQGPPPPSNPGEAEATRTGATEARASGDPGPLAPDVAVELLEGQEDDTGLLIRGILWSERPVPSEGSPTSPGGRW